MENTLDIKVVHNSLIFKEDERKIYDVYRAFKTLCEMIKDRNYVEFDHVKEISYEAFKEKYLNDNKEICYEDIEDSFTLNKIKIRWIDDLKPGVNIIKRCYNELKKDNKKRVILITKYKFTTQANSALEEMKNIGYIFDIFLQDELVVNITYHSSVPKHILLSNEEKAHILKIYNIPINKLPILKETDPISRYYAFKRGDVIKIVREKNGKKTISYRGVI